MLAFPSFVETIKNVLPGRAIARRRAFARQREALVSRGATPAHLARFDRLVSPPPPPPTDLALLKPTVEAVERLDAGEFPGARLDRVGEPEQQPAAVRGGGARPGREGLARRGDGRVDISRAGLGDLADRRAVVRVDHGVPAAFGRIDELPADEQAGLDAQVGQVHLRLRA